MTEEKKKIIGNITSVILLIGLFLIIIPLLIVAFEAHLLIGSLFLGMVLAIGAGITLNILQE